MKIINESEAVAKSPADSLTRTRAIWRLLQAATSPIAQWYTSEMEVQVNVAQDEGTRVSGEYKGRVWHGWQNTETGESWKGFRIPVNADTEPVFVDSVMTFDLLRRAEGVGMTGWNFVKKRTMWVGFDFDSISNHEKGISEMDLAEVINEASKLPYVGILRSTSGKGLHLYIKLADGGFPTENHREHAAVARAILTLLSADIGYNFKAKVDCVGSILWAWHRKQEGTNGLQWIKESVSDLALNRVPENWREHLSVVSRRRNKLRVRSGMEEVTASVKEVELDGGHRRILKWFANSAKKSWWWDNDNFMLVAHTVDFKACHTELKLHGLYDTVSKGEDNEQNCFAFPVKGGRFVIRRFGLGAREHNSWAVDEKGWTKTLFNESPSFAKAMRFFGGLENSKGEFVFNRLATIEGEPTGLVSALDFLGIHLEHSPLIGTRQVSVKHSKRDAKLIFKVKRENGDSPERGWIAEKGVWEKVITYSENEEAESWDMCMDAYVRHVVSNGTSVGWWVNAQGNWTFHSRVDVGAVVKSLYPDLTANDVQVAMGKAILDPWEKTCLPLVEEYPGGRTWNRDAAQFAFVPAPGPCPTWLDVLNHVGFNLTSDLAANEWCCTHGILTGGEYLMAWIASMFQNPEQPLPYLFLFGDQNTGKSTLHEALGMLFKDGVGYTDAALAFQSNFNGELEGALLGYIEEVDLSVERGVYNKIKKLVTAKSLLVRRMNTDAYTVPNYVKLIQVSNVATYIPVFPGDTRVSVIEVPVLKRDVPKEILLGNLRAEAPAFLDMVMSYHLPPPAGRLGIPAVETSTKKEIQRSNFNLVEEFIDTQCKLVLGHKVTFSEFYMEFKNWMLAEGLDMSGKTLSNKKVALMLPHLAPLCRGNDPTTNVVWLGNIVIVRDASDAEVKPRGEYYVDHRRKLCYRENPSEKVLRQLEKEQSANERLRFAQTGYPEKVVRDISSVSDLADDSEVLDLGSEYEDIINEETDDE